MIISKKNYVDFTINFKMNECDLNAPIQDALKGSTLMVEIIIDENYQFQQFLI